MDNDKIFRIKTDLRQLRKITHNIDTALEVERKHKNRLELLRASTPTKEVVENIQKIENILATLNIKKYISLATELELTYMGAIEKLEPMDKTIILQGYINGTAYWKIGRDIGYTEVGIQKRVNKIIEKLATII